MDAALMAKAVVEGGAAVVALYLLAGLKAELGNLAGRLDTLVTMLAKGNDNGPR